MTDLTDELLDQRRTPFEVTHLRARGTPETADDVADGIWRLCEIIDQHALHQIVPTAEELRSWADGLSAMLEDATHVAAVLYAVCKPQVKPATRKAKH